MCQPHAPRLPRAPRPHALRRAILAPALHCAPDPACPLTPASPLAPDTESGSTVVGMCSGALMPIEEISVLPYVTDARVTACPPDHIAQWHLSSAHTGRNHWNVPFQPTEVELEWKNLQVQLG